MKTWGFSRSRKTCVTCGALCWQAHSHTNTFSARPLYHQAQRSLDSWPQKVIVIVCVVKRVQTDRELSQSHRNSAVEGLVYHCNVGMVARLVYSITVLVVWCDYKHIDAFNRPIEWNGIFATTIHFNFSTFMLAVTSCSRTQTVDRLHGM